MASLVRAFVREVVSVLLWVGRGGGCLLKAASAHESNYFRLPGETSWNNSAAVPCAPCCNRLESVLLPEKKHTSDGNWLLHTLQKCKGSNFNWKMFCEQEGESTFFCVRSRFLSVWIISGHQFCSEDFGLGSFRLVDEPSGGYTLHYKHLCDQIFVLRICVKRGLNVVD